MIEKRYLTSSILEDLKEKMVFIGGPRQIGKTTLASYIGKKHYKKFSYLNWDLRQDRRRIQAGTFEEADLVVFDELHKYRQWKSFIKGIYDSSRFKKEEDAFHIIVTGSARLDVYRKGGDSLMGRYFHFRLHPFSLAEGIGKFPNGMEFGKKLVFADETPEIVKMAERLYTYGGFPEPFLAGNEKALKRFHNQRLDRLLVEDVRDLERVVELTKLENLAYMLPEKVGSLLSLNSLCTDLEVSFNTVRSWVELFERLYYVYRIYPYNVKRARMIKKQSKAFMWDWSQVADGGARMENMVASHLLKFSHYAYDVLGEKVDVFFLRDKEGREVDFFVTYEGRPWFLVEVKSGDMSPSKHLDYFARQLGVPYVYQVVAESGVHNICRGVEILSVGKFLTAFV